MLIDLELFIYHYSSTLLWVLTDVSMNRIMEYNEQSLTAVALWTSYSNILKDLCKAKWQSHPGRLC